MQVCIDVNILLCIPEYQLTHTPKLYYLLGLYNTELNSNLLQYFCDYKTVQNFTTSMRERRLAFYGPLTRMNPCRLANNRRKASKNKRFATVKSDLEQLEIRLETV